MSEQQRITAWVIEANEGDQMYSGTGPTVAWKDEDALIQYDYVDGCADAGNRVVLVRDNPDAEWRIEEVLPAPLPVGKVVQGRVTFVNDIDKKIEAVVEVEGGMLVSVFANCAEELLPEVRGRLVTLEPSKDRPSHLRVAAVVAG